MRNLTLTFLLALLVVITAMSVQRMVAGSATVAGESPILVAIGTDPVPLGGPKIGTDPVPLGGPKIGTDPVPLGGPKRMAIGTDPVPLGGPKLVAIGTDPVPLGGPKKN